MLSSSLEQKAGNIADGHCRMNAHEDYSARRVYASAKLCMQL